MGGGPVVHCQWRPVLLPPSYCPLLVAQITDLEIFIIFTSHIRLQTSDITIAEDVCEVGLELSDLLNILAVIHHSQVASPAQVGGKDPASTGDQNEINISSF